VFRVRTGAARLPSVEVVDTRQTAGIEGEVEHRGVVLDALW
jgi:hypothetical protein